MKKYFSQGTFWFWVVIVAFTVLAFVWSWWCLTGTAVSLLLLFIVVDLSETIDEM